MKFEVLRDGKVLEHTEYKECVKPLSILKSMQQAGYKFRLNGKAWILTAKSYKDIEV